MQFVFINDDGGCGRGDSWLVASKEAPAWCQYRGGRGVRENGNALLALHADRRYELILDASCITGESAATHNNKTTRSPDNRLVKRSDPGLVKLQATRRAGRCGRRDRRRVLTSFLQSYGRRDGFRNPNEEREVILSSEAVEQRGG